MNSMLNRLYESPSVNKKSEKRTDSKTNKAVHKAPPKPPFKSPPKSVHKAPKTPVKAAAKTTKSPKSAKVSKASTAKRRCEKDNITVDAETPVKKARKGYVYEPIPPPVQHVNVSVLEIGLRWTAPAADSCITSVVGEPATYKAPVGRIDASPRRE
ncbi:hypothetical protein ANCDUO_16260 [Ancylostoma duodenale]|uniref:Uncharacterized protein n=1 Tax=Ancylostoma duodenale TaxID=51022 RepID=A0A0C2CUV0_9BILA|nr:hypothetical protein ANCDUO_16260 [Ancylostoma duodenale]